MSIMYVCDRCGAESDMNVREVSVDFVGVDTRTLNEPGSYHLCGFCASKLRQFIDNKTVERN